MKLSKMIGLVLTLVLFAGMPATAAEYGTKEQAQAMAEKAAALVKANPQEAFKTFQNKEGGFFDRDLYVFVNDKDGLFVAHGAKPVLVGKSGLAMKDVTGFAFVKAFLETKDAGWVDYKWPDPSDGGKVKDKSSYIIKVGDYFVGVGCYKN